MKTQGLMSYAIITTRPWSVLTESRPLAAARMTVECLTMRARALVLSLVLAVVALPGCVSGSSSSRDADVQRVVVISAVPAELDRLLAAARIERTVEIAGRTHHVGRLEGHPVVLVLAGISMVNAAAATQAVIDHFDVGGIVFSGIAGGVNPDLSIGDVVVPAQWAQHQEMVFARATEDGWDTDARAGEFENFGMMFSRGQLLMGGGPGARPGRRQFWFSVDADMLSVAREVAADVTLASRLPDGECLEHQPRVVVGGNGVSGSTFVNNAEFREWIWRTFAAEALDMETAAVCQVAALNDVPFLGFRSLSDLAGGNERGNQARVFGTLAADNSATVLLEFLRVWPGPS